MRLRNWIDERHLDEVAQAGYRSNFADSPHASVLIDNFISHSKLTTLQRVFSTEGRFEIQHYLRGDAVEPGRTTEMPVSLETWRAASERDRASVECSFMEAHPDHRLGEGIITQCKFKEMLQSCEFMSFIDAVTGIRPEALTGMMIRMVSAGQYIRPHSDSHPSRDLCAVFYVSEGWEPRFGGRFRHRGDDASCEAIEPRCNRLLLFQPRRGRKHDVEATTDAGALWQRWAYTLWFGPPKPD